MRAGGLQMGEFVDGLAHGWPIALLGAGGIGGPYILITKWWEHQRAKRKQTDDASLAIVSELRELVGQLQTRIQGLETAQSAERAACEAKLEVERHKRHNLVTCVEMLLVGYELEPDRMLAHVERVRARLAKVDDREAA